MPTAELQVQVEELERKFAAHQRKSALCQVLLGGLLLVLAGALLGIVPLPLRIRKIRTNHLLIEGHDGGGIQLWVSDAGEPMLTFRDNSDRTRAMLVADTSGQTMLTFWDDAGKQRSNVGLFKDGSPTVVMSDEGGAVRLHFLLEEDGSPFMYFKGPDGELLQSIP